MSKINLIINNILKDFLNREFVQKNYKKIEKLVFFISFLLIVKLFSFGGRFTSGGRLSIMPGFQYSWTMAAYVSISLFLFFIFLYFIIISEKNNILRLKFVFLMLVLAIFSKQIFLFLSPDFKFYLKPVSKQYKDESGNITDMDKYLLLINKYCKNDGFMFKLKNRNYMCGEYDKYHDDFSTSDEYIKVLNNAKNNDFGFLYYITIFELKKSNLLEKVIKEYQDKTFYAYLIYYFGRENNILSYIKANNLNNHFEKLIIYYEKLLVVYNKDKLNLEPYKRDELYKNLLKKYTIEFNKLSE